MNGNFVDGQLFELVGRLISCIVSTLMVFQFFDTRYFRVYNSKLLYIGVKVVCCIINYALYFFNSPTINLGYWLGMIVLTSRFLYYDEKSSKGKYYIINIVFILAYSTCEALGGILAKVGVRILDISQKETIVSFVCTIGSSASAILLYYVILKRLFIKNVERKISMMQYTIYIVMTTYVLINIGEILFLIKHELNNKDYIFLLMDAVFVIFINLYLFYMLDTYAENKDLKYKLALYERQAKSNYEYYAKQAESKKTALAVIHDVRKHIRIMEELRYDGTNSEMESYVNSFEDMIAPLLINQYCDNAILNIIINDKLVECQKKGIHFNIDIQRININFLKQIDITTIFGNILDNAVEACEKAVEKQISLKVYPFNEFIYVQLSNTFLGEVEWNGKGKPISNKGEQHGIGLENVEKVLMNYNGNIQFSVEYDIFVVEIMLNKP